jgi:N-acyl homoserine lactone hydrolase
VHGFVVMHPKGAILVDSGVGGPDKWLTDWRCVNRDMAEALAEQDLVPGDITLVINTHLHFDHCGQNAVFRHAPFYVQRAELERARRESPELTDWFDFAGARFELLEGDAEIAPGVRVVATPGHTTGHQSVVVDGDGAELLIGDAAYRPGIYLDPDLARLPSGQAADEGSWRETIRRLHASRPNHVHFCHDTRVLHG